jgi:transketolase
VARTAGAQDVESSLSEEKLAFLQAKSRIIRRSIIEMVYRANSGHIGGSLGAADLLVTLYYHLMRHDPQRPAWPERDRFILSKGHCTPVLYAILADSGYFPAEDLMTFRRPGSHLQGHPYQPKTPGVDASTGTLALGISTGVGMALAAKLRGQSHRVYIVCGDGEIQEGQAWEAALFANKYHLDNVVAFVDRNFQQTDGYSEDIMPLEPLRPKWEAFGWDTQEIDGHDHAAIDAAVRMAWRTPGQPNMIIARTTKGKGVSFMEDDPTWHGTPPDRNQYERAMRELSRGV